MVISNEGIKKILPQTVERLAALEQLHKKGKTVNNKITLQMTFLKYICSSGI